MSETKKSVAVVVGVGPGLGASLARRFGRTHAVAVNARNADALRAFAGELRGAGATVLDVPGDVVDAAAVEGAYRAVAEGLGVPDVLIYNAAAGPFGNLAAVTPAQFENSLRVNALGAFHWVKQCAPAMAARGSGVILFTGATAGRKAGARSVAFGPGSFARRGLAQSLARDFGPQGVHVCWIEVDGVIDVPGRTIPGLGKEDMLDPDAIAETFWQVAHQHPSAWTNELEVRPFKEKF